MFEGKFPAFIKQSARSLINRAEETVGSDRVCGEGSQCISAVQPFPRKYLKGPIEETVSLSAHFLEGHIMLPVKKKKKFKSVVIITLSDVSFNERCDWLAL